MRVTGHKKLTLFVLLFMLLLQHESSAVRCYNCVSLKSDRLEDCKKIGGVIAEFNKTTLSRVADRRVEQSQDDKRKICLKMKVFAVDENGQEMSITIRSTTNGHNVQPQQLQNCTSALDQQAFNFAIQPLQNDNLSITLAQICRCNDTDFCNGQGKSTANSSLSVIIIIGLLFFYSIK